MASFSLEIDDRTEEEMEKDRAMRKHHQTNETAKPPMDTELQEDLGYVPPHIRISSKFPTEIQGVKAEPDQHERFNRQSLFDAVSSGDVSRLQGLKEYLSKTNKKLTSDDYQPSGKTVLMKALLNLKDGDTTVEHLLGIAERNNDLQELVNAAYKDFYYKGQTALHIAIERRNKHYVELLIQKGADVHAQASGTFFRSDSEPGFYFGELPLSLAACTNQKDIVDLLMDKADVRCKDTLGNTVLHALVMVNDNSPENTDFVISMYDYILTKDAAKNPKEKRLEDIVNIQRLTPIKLAAELGRIRLLEHILHRVFQQEECRHLSRKFREWVYGPVSGSLYDLDSVDTYKPNSVLEIVVYGPEIPNRLQMLQIEPLNKLLEDKWNRFAKWIFLFKLIVYIMYLTIFTAVKDPVGFLLLAGQVIMAIGSLYFLVSVFMDLNKKQPSMQTMLEDGYSDLLFLLQAGLFIISAGLYFGGMQEYLAFLVVSVAVCWVNLLYYSRGIQSMGIYNIMIQRIFLKDILRFLYVYLVFLLGFSAAMVTLLKEPENRRSLDTADQNATGGCKKPTFKTIAFTTLELFKFTIGMGDLEFTEDYEYKHVFYVLLVSYLVLTYILLLNMLIALMSKTVDDMSEENTDIWKLQRGIAILDLERHACCLKRTWRSGVKRNLGKKDEDWRWCLRVEEVNWKNWNCNLGIIREDPGECDTYAVSAMSADRDANNIKSRQGKRHNP